MIDDITAAASSAVSSANDGISILSSEVETVGGMAKLIQEYGPFIVILAVFLLLFLGLMAYMIKANANANKQMLEQQKAASELNQQMTKQMMEVMINLVNKDNSSHDDNDKSHNEDDDDEEEEHHPKKKKKKQIVSSYIDSALAFKDAARIAIGKIHCERVAIYLFHNGNHTPYGYPFAKMSCVYEWNARGANTVRGANHVNVPLYAFTTIVEGLIKDGEFAVCNTYDHGILSADEQVFQFISGSSIRSLFALGIKDADGYLAAFTIAEFIEPQDFAAADTYISVKSALKTMNDNIYSIIVNADFRDSHTEDSSK